VGQIIKVVVWSMYYRGILDCGGLERYMLWCELVVFTGRPLIRYKPMSGEPRPHEFPTSAAFSHNEDFGMLLNIICTSAVLPNFNATRLSCEAH